LLLRHGSEHAAVLVHGLTTWMARNGFQTIDQFHGMLAVPADTDQDGYERASYVSAMRAANARAYKTY
jgi:dihydroorotate dehydrogenase (fumarate)